MPGPRSRQSEYPAYIAFRTADRKVPGKFFDLGISGAIGKTMIESITVGRSLPPEFERQLPIID